MNDEKEISSNGKARQSLIARLAGVILAPRKTIPKLAVEPGYWMPIAILAASLFLLRMTSIGELQAEYRAPEYRLKYSEQMDIPIDEADQQLETLARFMPLILLLEAPVMVGIGVAGVAGLLFLIGRIAYQSKAPFRQLFSIVAWSSIIGAIPLLLTIPLYLAGWDFTLPTSPAFFLPSSFEDGYFYKVMQSIDLFPIWQVWLLSIGMASVYKISLQRAVGSVGTMYVMFVVLNALMMSVGQ